MTHCFSSRATGLVACTPSQRLPVREQLYPAGVAPLCETYVLGKQLDMAQPPSKGTLSEEMRKIIHGHIDHSQKREQYQSSLQNWWKDYSHRKNDEEDMVADSLLYDERCHLPRTTAGPKAEPEPEVTAAPGPSTPERPLVKEDITLQPLPTQQQQQQPAQQP